MDAAMPDKARVRPAKPRKLLVFTLCHGFVHSSIPYAANALETLGRRTGAFSAVVSDDIAVFEPDRLQSFDAVCMDNTTLRSFLPANFKQLPEAEKKAAQESDVRRKKSLLDFVRGGKGLVGIHAATDCFYNWPEYGDMIGGFFWGHPWHEDVGVKLDDPSHPLCAAFKGRDFTIKDEIYQFKDPYSRKTLRVLLSLDTAKTNMDKGERIHRKDGDFAVSWIRSYGKGRVFYCSLGHRHEIFWNPTILRHYLDGIQFALGDLPADTTPSAELSQAYLDRSRNAVKRLAFDATFEEAAKYELAGDAASLKRIAERVLRAHDNPQQRKELEKRLAALLASDATPDGKRFACRQLFLMGSEDAVPAIATLLTDPQLSDMARYALERIPGSAATQALRSALGRVQGRLKIGVVNSLGARRDLQAVPALSALLANKDEEVARAAAVALGKIGGDAAAQALSAIGAKAPPELRAAAHDALLRCAEQMLRPGGDRTKAAAICQAVQAQRAAKHIQVAAFRTLVLARGRDALPLVIDALVAGDLEMRKAAIHFVRTMPGAAATRAFAEQVPKLDPTGQAMVVYALGDRGDALALPAVVNASGSEHEPVRIAALRAMARVGDASVAPRLAEVGARAAGAEQQAARKSLDRLSATGVDEALAACVRSAETPVRIEAIVRLRARRAVSAVLTLLNAARNDKDKPVRREALKALSVLGAEKDLPTLVDILVNQPKGGEHAQAEKAAADVAKKIDDEARRCDVALAALAKASDPPVRCSLLRVLGRIGAPKGLAAARVALKDANKDVQDAAVRSLADWPNCDALADLRGIAEADPDMTHHVLALRGYARLIALPSDRSTVEALALYERGMALAKRDDERKLLLAGLGNVTHPHALKLAESYFGNDALQAEATMAAAQIFHGLSAPKAVTASRNADNARNAIDADIKTRWSTNEPQKAGQWYMLDLGYDKAVRKITLDSTNSPRDYPKGYEVYVSRSKEEWGEPVAKGQGKTTIVHIEFKPKVGRYVKIVQTRTEGHWYWSIHDLRINDEPTAPMSGRPISDRSAWNATASVADEHAKNVIDGDMDTRWGTWGPQKEGQWLMVDLGVERKVCRIVMDAGKSRGDYPRGYRVYVSKDSNAWGPPVAGGGAAPVRADVPVYPKVGRYVKIVQTGSTDRMWWSVYELNVFAE